jgi:hypothetical protein
MPQKVGDQPKSNGAKLTINFLSQPALNSSCALLAAANSVLLTVSLSGRCTVTRSQISENGTGVTALMSS